MVWSRRRWRASLARLLLTPPTTMTPTGRILPTSPARRVSRASLAWAFAITSVACVERSRPAARRDVALVAPPITGDAAPTTVVRPSQAAPDARTEAPAVASTPDAPTPCEPLTIDAHEVHQSTPRIYAAARRYFLAHTGPGSLHPLGPELLRERPTLRFSNVYERATGAVMQATIDEIATRYPASLVFPTRRRPRLQTDACYDEVYLDLTEDGRYVVIVETATARPVFMYWQQYRP